MNSQQNKINIAYISVGSNMGNSLNGCRKGVEALNSYPGIFIEKISSFYYTEPMELKKQSWFVNAALKIQTSENPFSLLKILKEIEKKMGRVCSDVRYGPRKIDFDIIFYNDVIISTNELAVPHPRMHYREFVLRPLCDLDPDKIHPVLNMPLIKLLDDIKGEKQQCIKIDSADDIPDSEINDINKADQEEVNNEVLY